MTCPICHLALERATLLPADGAGPDLRGFRCAQSHGVFLPSDFYVDWRDAQASPEARLGALPKAEAVGDVRRAKLCPQDGRIMERARVSSDGSFWLDRCGTCGGIWFDGSEWEASVAAGLHERLTRVFTDAWQREIEAAEQEAYRVSKLDEALGHDDLERIEAFRAWAWAHPERHLVMARLNERPMAREGE